MGVAREEGMRYLKMEEEERIMGKGKERGASEEVEEEEEAPMQEE